MKFVFDARVFSVPAFLLGLFVTGCGGATDAGSLTGCSSTSDCAGGEACIGLNGEGQCHFTCTATADECGGSASCEGIGGVSLNVCKEKKEEPSSSTGGGAAETTEEPEEDWLRCATDEDCSVIDASAICGTWKGASYCTIGCSDDSVCNPPTVGGITTSFLACLTDEAQTTRSICVPREECFNDPMSCIEMDVPGGFDGTGGGSSEPGGGSGGGFGEPNSGTGGDFSGEFEF